MKHARIAYGGTIHQAAAILGNDSHLRLADGHVLHESEVVWLSPVIPRTVFALGLNYADRAKEPAFRAPGESLAFLKGLNMLIGHRTHAVRPTGVTFIHYECELVVVIGKIAYDVPREYTYGCVAGYSVANDCAVHDYLEDYYRPNLRVKSRDTDTPIGPWLANRDDVPDSMNLTLRTTANGHVAQEGSTRSIIFDIPVLIARFSSLVTLSPGDMILAGTSGGLADTRPDDGIITEIKGIDRLMNTIIAEESNKEPA